MLKRYTPTGEEHGLINRLTNSVAPDDFKNMTPAMKVKAEAEKKDDARLVEAQYWNARGVHERLTFPYCKYAGEPILIFNLIPGYTYSLPYGAIKQVNDPNKYMKKRSGLVSVDGASINKDDSPLDKDQSGDWLHKLVPVGF